MKPVSVSALEKRIRRRLKKDGMKMMKMANSYLVITSSGQLKGKIATTEQFIDFIFELGVVGAGEDFSLPELENKSQKVIKFQTLVRRMRRELAKDDLGLKHSMGAYYIVRKDNPDIVFEVIGDADGLVEYAMSYGTMDWRFEKFDKETEDRLAHMAHLRLAA